MQLVNKERCAMYKSEGGRAVKLFISLPRSVAEDECERRTVESLNNFYSSLENTYVKSTEKYVAALPTEDGRHTRRSITVSVDWKLGEDLSSRGRIAIFHTCTISSPEGERSRSEKDVFELKRGILLK